MAVALVTGGNKGIGLSIVRQLALELTPRSGHVILASRSEQRGREAVETLKKEGLQNVSWRLLDLEDPNTMRAMSTYLGENFPQGFDILVNNAALAFKSNATEPFLQQAVETLKTNYFGTAQVCDHLLPRLKVNGRIVNISSSSGFLSHITNHKLKEAFEKDLTREKVDALMNKFISDVEAGRHREEGWPNSAYGVSKIGLNALTRVLASLPENKERLINACHPGYVKTEMSSYKGTKSPDEGAETPVWLALHPSLSISGGFFSDKKQIPF